MSKTSQYLFVEQPKEKGGRKVGEGMTMEDRLKWDEGRILWGRGRKCKEARNNTFYILTRKFKCKKEKKL